MSISILLVDHNNSRRRDLESHFLSCGDSVRTAASGSEARIAYAEHSPDIVILLQLAQEDAGSELPDFLYEDNPDIGLIIGASPAEMGSLTPYLARGALHTVLPVDVNALAALAHRLASFARQRAELELRRADERALAPLPAGVDMLIDLASRNPDTPILFVGEAGSGKGIAARLVHDLSSRGRGPFLNLRCNGAARTSVERTLFGHERGSTPESRRAAPGLLEMADSGSVLLQSITSLAFETQPSLLRFIEEGVYRRSGGSVDLRSGARILASSVRPVAASVDAGLFRADLFYRLQVLTIALPPLRERTGELDRLISFFSPPGVSITPAAMRALRNYSWPGNLRELRHVLWRASLLAGREAIERRHLPLPGVDAPPVVPVNTPGTTAAQSDEASPAPPPVPRLADLERSAILAALERTGGNKLRAAALLGIARSTLHEKLRKL